MSRPHLALAVIAAASVAGVWTQAVTHRAPPPVPTRAPAVLVGRAEIAPSVATGNHAAPDPDSRSRARAAIAVGGSRSPIASRDAEPEPATPSTANQRLDAAMKIAMDPATGQLVAPEHSGPAVTIAEMQDLARREAEGLVTIRNPDGSETLNHEGRFTDHTVIRVGPDGRWMFQCVHGQWGVDHAVRSVAPMTPNLEDR